MKKRINLTDGELAVGMWLYIKERIKTAEQNTEALAITDMKIQYLKEHGKKVNYWYNYCLLCQRYMVEGYNTKCKCPLSEGGLCCSVGSSWWIVTVYSHSEEHRQRALKACDKIIEVMKKEAEKDEKGMEKERK